MTPLQIFWLIIGMLVIGFLIKVLFWIIAALKVLNTIKPEEWEQ